MSRLQITVDGDTAYESLELARAAIDSALVQLIDDYSYAAAVVKLDALDPFVKAASDGGSVKLEVV